jgi:hypothetical protein
VTRPLPHGAEVICRRVVNTVRPGDQRPCWVCDAVFEGDACPWCGVLREFEQVPTLDVVVTLENGSRWLVTARKDRDGRWTPVFARPATEARVRAWRRWAARNCSRSGLGVAL